MQSLIEKYFSHPFAVFLSIAILYLGGMFFRTVTIQRAVYGDGLYYYIAVRSIVIDHDINYTNEYETLKTRAPKTPLGIPGNVYPIGPSLLWLPSFLWIHSIIHGNGFSLPYQLVVAATGVAFVFVGYLVLYQVLLKYVNQSLARKTIFTLAFTTNLWYYGSLDTANSHSASFLIATVIISLILNKRPALYTGIFIGFLGMVRTQDALFLLLMTQSLSGLVTGGMGFVIGFFPQLIYWYTLYGTIGRSPYLDANHGFDFLHPKLLEVLFSNNNGLLFWTPYVGLGVFGFARSKFFPFALKSRFLVLLLLQWILIASWSFWWQGASFSGRMFISVLPLVAFGFAYILRSLNEKMQNIFIIVGVTATVSSMLLYYIFF